MSDSNRIIDQTYLDGVLPTPSSPRQHTTMQNVDRFDPSYLTQERSNYLNNDNSSISQSIFTKSSDSTIEQPAVVTPMVFSEQNCQTASKQIQMKSQPRDHYHPRNAKECSRASHFLRCEEGESQEYPTIYIKPEWLEESSSENYIEVALVDKDCQLHPYIIDNKERNRIAPPPTVSRPADKSSNTLLFLVADHDFVTSYKSFKIQLIKSKQDNYINKELIRERELYISMLRFTRIYLDKDGVYHRDEASTAYSCRMIEKYCDVSVVHINPRYGPLGGHQQLNVVVTGLKAPDRNKLSLEIVEKTCGWTCSIKEFNFIGNSIVFTMPAFPHPSDNNILTSILIYYDGEAIHEAPFVYIPMLDPILKEFNLNEEIAIEAVPTTSNDNDSSQASSSGSEKQPAENRAKRKRTN